MSDPYADWLDLPAHLRPPTHYQLLGIAPTELDPRAIAAAADRRLDRLKAHAAGARADEARRLEREVIEARDTLLDPVARLNYDTLTPDAADPWWKAEAGPPAAPPSAPVQGWWQGERPEDEKPVPVPVPEPLPVPAPAVIRTPTPEPVPAVPRSDDWWKAKPADRESAAPIHRPPPPAPERHSAPAPAAEAPLIREKTLAYITPEAGGSSVKWIVLSLVACGLAGAGAVAAWKFGLLDDPRVEERPVAEHKPTVEPPGVTTVTTESTVRPKVVTTVTVPRTVRTVPKIGVTTPVELPPPPAPPPESDTIAEPINFRGHQSGVLGVAVSRNGQTILTVGDDRGVLQHSIRDRGKPAQLHRLMSPGIALVLCSDDKTVAVCDGGEVVVYDVAARGVRAAFENPRGGIRSLAAAPDGTFVLTGTTDGAVRWWDVRSKTLAHTLDLDEKATVTAVAVTPDGRTAAVGLSDGRIGTWDLKARKETKRWKAHAGAVTHLSHAPDGTRFVSAGEDGAANVWRATGQLVHKLTGHEGPVMGTGWCSDGKRVATAGVDGKARLWVEDQGWKAAWTADLKDKAFSLAVDPRDRFVVAGLADGVARLVPLPAVKE